MKQNFVVGILLLLACVMPFTAIAKIYKWTDEEGNVHYSQLPPPNAAQKNIKQLDVGGSERHTTAIPEASADKQFCSIIQRYSIKVAAAMRNGMSIIQAKEFSIRANEKIKKILKTNQSVITNVVVYVYRFYKTQHSPEEIGGLVLSQCINGKFGGKESTLNKRS